MVLTEWKNFISQRTVADDAIRQVTLNSWKRCNEFNVNPFQKAAPIIKSGKILDADLKQQQELIEVSRPLMQSLAKFVSGSGFVIALADKHGMLLEVMGDQQIITTVADGNFVPGADWSEAGAGTNGIGTSLAVKKPIQIFGYEHYCICSHKWTCSGAPIHDAEGNIIAALDMSGSFEKVHPHTLGMVVGAAGSIENNLNTRRAWKAAEMANQYKDTIIESMSDALLAVNKAGIITHINQAALSILQMPRERLIDRDIHQVLGEPNRDLLNIIFYSCQQTDHEIDIVNVSGKIRCTVTVRSTTTGEGVVVVFNEISRARKLAYRMTGAVAKLTFDDIIGKNERFVEAVKLSQTAAKTHSSVLLLGESGSGKDIFAQSIHNSSTSYRGPFVSINCSAVPRELIASELFGYTEGTFNGDKKGGSPGKFELAEGGTLFLDEIDDLPLELQAMLIQVLEENKFVRFGDQQVIPVNVRVVAATSKDLRQAVKKGRFRQDLYHRLNVLTIELPPLRDRVDDISLLVEAFLKKLIQQYNKESIYVHDEAWQILKSYSWPGNVRELHNVLEQLVAVNRTGSITSDILPEEIKEEPPFTTRTILLEEYEKQVIGNLLKKYDGNISKVSDAMGVARTTLYRKLKKYHL